jgi:hypothetical protein
MDTDQAGGFRQARIQRRRLQRAAATVANGVPCTLY